MAGWRRGRGSGSSGGRARTAEAEAGPQGHPRDRVAAGVAAGEALQETVEHPSTRGRLVGAIGWCVGRLPVMCPYEQTGSGKANAAASRKVVPITKE